MQFRLEIRTTNGFLLLTKFDPPAIPRVGDAVRVDHRNVEVQSVRWDFVDAPSPNQEVDMIVTVTVV